MIEAPDGVVARLSHEFSRLPGIGPKSAERIVHSLLSGPKQQSIDLAKALQDVVHKVRPCRQCFNLAEGELCLICTNPRRDTHSLCVVESSRDVTIFERAGNYRGLYHVLGGRLAPLDGIGPEQLHLNELTHRIKTGEVREVILATSPTLEGDGTALYINNMLAGLGLTISQLARGLPTGSSLDLVNPQMLADALDGRRNL